MQIEMFIAPKDASARCASCRRSRPPPPPGDHHRGKPFGTCSPGWTGKAAHGGRPSPSTTRTRLDHATRSLAAEACGAAAHRHAHLLREASNRGGLKGLITIRDRWLLRYRAGRAGSPHSPAHQRAGHACGTEFLDLTFPYVADLVAWVAIGARTTESQTHRQMTSGSPCRFQEQHRWLLQNALNGSCRLVTRMLSGHQRDGSPPWSTTGNPTLSKLRGGNGRGTTRGHRPGGCPPLKRTSPAVFHRLLYDNSGKTPPSRPVSRTSAFVVGRAESWA
jgi:hypothetical protein